MEYKQLSEQGVYSMSLTNQDEKYFYVEIRALKPGVNRNQWDFTLEGIRKNGKSFVGQPLLIAYKGDKIGDGHNFDYTVDPLTGEIQADFRGAEAERIVGETTDTRIEEQVGETWLVLSARIWRYYAQQLVDYIIDNKAMDVSVEVEVADGYEVREDGVEVFTEWTGLGVTILGQGVTPAVEGARLRALAASEQYKEMRLIAASYVPTIHGNSKGGQQNMNKKNLAVAFSEYGKLLGLSADGKYASVLRNDGTPALYPLADFNEKDGIIPSKFIGASIVLSAEIAGEGDATETVVCSAEGIIETAQAEAETAKAEAEKCKEECEKKCEAATKELEEAKTRIADLEKAESERKLAEMTKAFDDAVNAYNITASSAELITEEEVNVIHNSIKEGKYADSEAVVGEFKKLAYDKHVAATKKEKKNLAWNFNDGKPAPTGEEAIMAHFIAAGEK